MLNLDDLTYKIRLDDSEVPRSAAATEAAMAKMAGAVAPAHRQFSELGRSTKLTRNELLTLNYTVNDVIASLASGASPFTILAQQGGQVTQAFGGVGNTFSKLGGLITVGRVAVTGMAAALGTLAFAYVDGARESDAFTKATGRSGNAAGLTEDGFRRLTREVSAATGATVGASREIVSGLIATGQIGGRALGEVAAAATAMAKAYDLSAAEVVKDFSGMSTGVAKWAAEHNKSMNFITAEEYRYIRSLEEQNRVSEAQIFTAQKVREASERVTKNLGWLEQAWDSVKKKAADAWDAMLGGGRAETTADQLARLSKDLSERQARGPLNDLVRGSFEKGNESLRQRINALREKARIEEQSARWTSEAALANQRAIADERAREGRRGDRREIGYAITDPLADQKQRFLRSEIEGRGATEKFLAEMESEATRQRKREEDEYRRRTEQGADFGRQLTEQAASVNASLIADDEARARAMLAIEKASISSRIQAMGLLPEQVAALEGKAALYILARERQLTEELKPEIDRRLALYADFNRYMKQQSDEFRDQFVESGRDAFRTWVETGKISATTITSFIRRKFADMVYDQFLAGIFNDLGRSIFRALTGIGGGGGGDIGITSAGLGLVDMGLGAGRAAGGSTRPWSLQEVNERGAEMLSVRGRDYLMMGSDWGKVTPAGATADRLGGGRQQVIDNSVSIGSVGDGVTRGELNSILRGFGAQQEARFRRLAADGRL